MDPQQFALFLEAMKGALGGDRTGGGNGGNGERQVLNHQLFANLEKFGGEENKWKEWSFNFRIALNSHGRRLQNVWGGIEQDRGELDWASIARWRDVAHREGMLDWFDKVAGELFGKLFFVRRGLFFRSGWTSTNVSSADL